MNRKEEGLKKQLRKTSSKEVVCMPKFEDILIYGFVGAISGKVVIDFVLREVFNFAFVSPYASAIIGLLLGLAYLYRHVILDFFK